MATERFDISTKQGETFTFLVTEYQDDGATPLTNVGYTGKLQVRERAGGALIVELTPGAGLTPGGANGQTMVRFGANHTALITRPAVYDLRYVSNTDSTDVRYPVEGSIGAEPRITQ